MASLSKPDKTQLANARTQAGLTQEELAAAVGCSVFSIGKYEQGVRSPRGPVLRRIADVTGKPLDFFFLADEVAA